MKKTKQAADALKKAARYCDKDGRVVKLIPEDLATELRKMHLMVGITFGRKCQFIGTDAWWYVIFNRKRQKHVLQQYAKTQGAYCRARQDRGRMVVSQLLKKRSMTAEQLDAEAGWNVSSTLGWLVKRGYVVQVGDRYYHATEYEGGDR